MEARGPHGARRFRIGDRRVLALRDVARRARPELHPDDRAEREAGGLFPAALRRGRRRHRSPFRRRGAVLPSLRPGRCLLAARRRVALDHAGAGQCHAGVRLAQRPGRA